jgi:hypothetical protein
MEMSTQLHHWSFIPGTIAHSIHWTEDWLSPYSGLDAVEKMTISCPIRESKSVRSARNPSLYRTSHPEQASVTFWRWVRHVLPKRLYVSTWLSTVSRQERTVLVFTGVWTSELGKKRNNWGGVEKNMKPSDCLRGLRSLCHRIKCIRVLGDRSKAHTIIQGTSQDNAPMLRGDLKNKERKPTAREL